MSEKNESSKSFWTTKKLLVVFLLFVGIAIGAALQHYLIEPLLEGSLAEQLKKCKTENLEIHNSLAKCIASSK